MQGDQANDRANDVGKDRATHTANHTANQTVGGGSDGSRGNVSQSAGASAAELLQPQRLAALLGATFPESPVAELTSGRGVAFDSRRVRPGDVFFALPGAAGHGIEHAADALARGAAYLVSDRPHERALVVDDAYGALVRLGSHARSLLRSPIVGITGSAGKTTTKTLVTAALAARSTPGNLNTVPALVAALVEGALMDAAKPQGSSGRGINRGALVGVGGPGTPVVLELGIDRPGEMAELLAFCRPDHGVVTTIGESHLAALGDVASVAREKSLLLAEAPGVRLAGAGAAARLPGPVANRTVIVTAQTPSAAVLRFMGRDYTLPWPGRAMAENVALALTLAVELGIDAGTAFARLLEAQLEPGRLQRRELRDLHIIDDSYNSNPLSAALALEVLNAAPRPRVAVLGDMRELGAVSRERHLELGAATNDLDLVIAVGEEAAALAESNPRALWAPDAQAALALLDRVPRGATVLVKGSRSLGLERVVTALEAR